MRVNIAISAYEKQVDKRFSVSTYDFSFFFFFGIKRKRLAGKKLKYIKIEIF